jgi:multidrug efflux pump subunit AcrB
MERTITIPLEDALSAVPGAKNIQSSSENGRTRVFVRFNGEAKGRYEAVRDAVQRMYESLPSSVQRPEIQSSSGARIPLWTAAVTAGPLFQGSLAGFLERTVKPRLESLEGSGEVEISGTGTNEIAVVLKQERAAAAGITPSDAAAALGMNDILLSAGKVKENGREISVVVDGRYDDLSGAFIPLDGGYSRLDDIAGVYEQEREPEILSRLNGKRTAVIAVMGNNEDAEKLSRAIREEIKKFSGDIEFTVLSDRGEEEAAAYRSVLIAALQGSLMVALAAALFTSGRGKGPRTALVCAFSVPLICLVSAGVLAFAGMRPDRALLGGIAAGVGSAVDTAILSSGKFAACGALSEGKDALKRLFVPLVSGAVTTIAALVPLLSVSPARALVLAVGAVNAVSLVTALVLLPPLFLWDQGSAVKFKRKARRAPRVFFRLLAFSVKFSVEKSRIIQGAAVLLSAGGILAVILAGADPLSAASENSVYAHIEFDGGLLAEEVDRRLVEFSETLAAAEEIKTVQTGARIGSGSALITFDPKKTGADRIREKARSVEVSGGFVYFPETSPGERVWEISVSGDDGGKCREFAKESAGVCSSLSLIRETVLNFKDGTKRLTFLPDREKLRWAGISFYQFAEAARQGVHGLIAYKRIGAGGETDVRIRGAGGTDRRPALSRKETSELLALTRNSALDLGSLSLSREDSEPSGIRREGRRRIASVSIRTRPMDPRRVRDEVMKELRKINLPPGYVFEFDREAIEAAEALSGTVFSFLAALLFCYMVIASVNESFGIPFAVLSVVPPSMAVPAIVLAVSGSFNSAVACAFVTVTGMEVNASVLIAGEIKDTGNLYRALRKVLPTLVATAGTTIAGALPFLFLTEGSNILMRTLALVTMLGVGSSCIFSFTLLPGFAKKIMN